MKLSKPTRNVIKDVKVLSKGLKLVDIMKVMPTRRKPGQKQKSTRQLLIEFMTEQKEFNKQIISRLDKYDELFKKHGWTK